MSSPRSTGWGATRMTERTFVLVNPSSRSGATRRRLPELEALLRKHIGDYELLCTERLGDGERLARDAVERGATRLVVAGGDGTVSEAVSGLLLAERAAGRSAELAIVPLGTGRDFARLLGLGADLESAVARLSTGKKRAVDAGRVRCRANDGSERVRCFLNIASIGLTAVSTQWLAEQSKRGPLSYVKSGIVGMLRHPMTPVTIRVDGRVAHQGPLTFAAIANGRYFGGGMKVAPAATIDDGALEVVVVPGMPILRLMRLFPALFIGRHVEDRRIGVHRGAVVHAESAEEVWMEADGEPIGKLPATIELLPGGVRLCGLP